MYDFKTTIAKIHHISRLEAGHRNIRLFAQIQKIGGHVFFMRQIIKGISVDSGQTKMPYEADFDKFGDPSRVIAVSTLHAARIVLGCAALFKGIHAVWAGY